MQIFNYDALTKEFLMETTADLDPLESQVQGEDVYLLPAHATFVEAPVAGDNEVAVFDEGTETWSLEADYRGTTQYDENGVESVVENIGDEPDVTDEAPTEGLVKPFWNGSAWEESGLLYMGVHVETKADVDRITKRAIENLGEEKAKTLKLIAGDGACPEWDAFVADRNQLVADGDQFVIDNSLV